MFADKLVLIVVIPVIIIFLLSCVPYFILWLQSRLDMDDNPEERIARTHGREKIVRLIVFALSLLYPSVSSSVISFFQCRTVAGKRYLIADFVSLGVL